MGNIADTILVPGVYITVDNSLANTATGGAFKTVIVGQKTASGTATAETLTRVFSKAGSAGLFGNGSILDEMFDGWFKTNNISEVYAIALDDADASAAGTQTLTVTVTTAETGTLSLYVNGKLIRVGVTAAQTDAQIATAVAAAITADVTLPITASAVSEVVTCTAKNKGTLGNLIDLRFNEATGQAFPTGVSVAIATGVTGATDPDIADAIAALPDEVFKVIVNPYTDSTSTGILKTELDRRWGATVQLDGHAIMSSGGTASTVATLGDTLNSEHFTFIDAGKNTMKPQYFWASDLAGRVSYSAAADSSRQFGTLPLSGITGDAASDRRTKSEMAAILSSGIGTHRVLPDGSVVISRLVTTYKTNAQGASDNSYLSTPTMFVLSDWRQAEITRMLSRFPRHKLGDDGQNFGAGQPIATPATIKGEYIALYEEFERDGKLENTQEYANNLIVERDATNRGRVNVTQRIQILGNLYQFDVTLQFIV